MKEQKVHEQFLSEVLSSFINVTQSSSRASFCSLLLCSKSCADWDETVAFPVANHVFPVRTDFKSAADGNH